VIHPHDLRETAKHYLMMGYALIRRILLELDRRFRLAEGIFFLTLEDLPELAAGKDLADRIAGRRRSACVSPGTTGTAVHPCTARQTAPRTAGHKRPALLPCSRRIQRRRPAE
jgi:hypothetical protein